MPLIQRDEERRLLLGALGSAADLDALSLCLPYLDDANVKNEAAATVMALAEKREKKQYIVMTREALGRVVKIAADQPAVVQRANRVAETDGDGVSTRRPRACQGG
ncbi:MAG: hypothetical protein NTV49_05115 [Kiritimatiellaeota bacterium]|nr:hypothetical protein [Kiritimatiellota bacterium]